MPSKFGGVPVEEERQHPGSKFGGVPVDDSPAAPTVTPDEVKAARFSAPGIPAAPVPPALSVPHVTDADRRHAPGIPAAPLPADLKSDTPTGTGRQVMPDIPRHNPLYHDIIPEIANRPAKGASDALRYAGGLLSPLAAPAAFMAPITTAGGAIAGYGAQKLGEYGASALGASPDTSQLTGDVAGLIGGIGGAKVAKSAGGAVAEGLANSALGTTAKNRQFNSNPGRAALIETSGNSPEAVSESARGRIQTLTPQMEQLVKQSGPIDLSAPRGRIASGKDLAIKQNDPTLHRELEPMGETLDQNFSTGQPYERSVPAPTALDLRRGFSNQHVRWVQGRTGGANDVAKGAYSDITDAIHKGAPGTEELDSRVHNLIPVRDLGTKASLHAGPIETGVNRMTRPTGGLLPTIAGFLHGGPIGGAAVMAGQEALGMPTVKMALARGIHRGVAGQIIK